MSVSLIRHAGAVDPLPQDSEYSDGRYWKIEGSSKGVKALAFFSG
jgi:hypothetical protein